MGVPEYCGLSKTSILYPNCGEDVSASVQSTITWLPLWRALPSAAMASITGLSGWFSLNVCLRPGSRFLGNCLFSV